MGHTARPSRKILHLNVRCAWSDSYYQPGHTLWLEGHRGGLCREALRRRGMGSRAGFFGSSWRGDRADTDSSFPPPPSPPPLHPNQPKQKKLGLGTGVKVASVAMDSSPSAAVGARPLLPKQTRPWGLKSRDGIRQTIEIHVDIFTGILTQK